MLSLDRLKNRNASGTLVGFNESQDEHRNTVCPSHPESSHRIHKIKEAFQITGLLEKCEVLTSFREIDDGDLEVTHRKAMVEELLRTEKKEQKDINELCDEYDSMFMTPKSITAARDAVACVRELTRRIVSDSAANGFAVIRPPGHHADAAVPCGFCLFNNVAQAAEEAFNGGAERILIVDLDVHHGQGTQRIFYDDKRVLYFSIHRFEHGLFWPHLPESNFDWIGKGAGLGFNANVPLNETGCGDADYLSVLFHVLLPLATQFNPHFVIVSAGFDCLSGDPIGGMNLSPDGYAHIIYHLKALAQGRMLVVLEGGYNHDVSAVAAQKCLRVLLGHAPLPVELKDPPKESTVVSCISIVSVLRHHWNCFDYFPSRQSIRHPERPIIDLIVEFKYESSKRTPNTAEIVQDQLCTQSFSKSDYAPAEPQETLIFFNEGDEAHYDLDESASNHPEQPARTRRILKILRESGCVEKCTERNCERLATDEEIRVVHTKEMLGHLKTLKTKNVEELLEEASSFNSIYFTRETLEVARKAVGCVLQSIDEIYEKEAGLRNGFVVVRPPGHHASSDKPSGFCIFNNVALAAEYARRKYSARRVLILDWDIHHGNGTQEIFYNDPNVMYMSIHGHEKGGFYPTGEPKDFSDVGENAGKGFSVNIPFSDGTMGDAEYQLAFQHAILPIAYQFNPDLVLISAGFDAAVNDPLGHYEVTPETFALLTYQLSSLASGRILAILEGGYNLVSISESALAVCEVLQKRAMSRRVHETEKKKLESTSIRTIREVCETQQEFWSILKGFQVVPEDSLQQPNNMSSQQPASASVESRLAAAIAEFGCAHAVVPLSTCPHVELIVQSPPTGGIDAKALCSECEIGAEVWTCLTCYKYNCGRFVNMHAKAHYEGTSHPMALSMSDLSVWCYPCESYVHNRAFIPAKTAAHKSKFGEDMPA